MEKIWTIAKKLAKEEEGMETVEYAVVAALVILAAAGAWATLGTNINNVITTLYGKVVAPAG